MKSLSWHQNRAFTDREWRLISDFAGHAANAYKDQGVTLKLTGRPPRTLTIQGPVMQRGEAFVLGQDNAPEVFECKTLAHPYGELAYAVLSFVGKNLPEVLSVSRELDGIEERGGDFEMSLQRARAMLLKEGFAGTTDELVTALGNEYGYDEECIRDSVVQARQEVNEGRVTNLTLAHAQCQESAAAIFRNTPWVEFNRIVSYLADAYWVEDVVARTATEQAYREVVDHRPVVALLQSAKNRSLIEQAGCRTSGDLTVAAGFAWMSESKLRLEFHVGTLLARASGEWEVGLAIAERALGQDEAFFQLARLAAAAAADPDPFCAPQENYCFVAYQQQQTRREAAYQVLGDYAKWQDTALQLTANLVALSTHLEDNPFVRLDAFLSGGKFDCSPNPIPTVAQSVAKLAEHASVLDALKPGGYPEVARDYLNILEVVDQLGLESTVGTAEFATLNRQAWGTDQTSAQMREEAALELQGTAMLGEATVQELDGVVGQSFDLYRAEGEVSNRPRPKR